MKQVRYRGRSRKETRSGRKGRVVVLLAGGLLGVGAFLLAPRFYVVSEVLGSLAFVALLVLVAAGLLLIAVFIQEAWQSSLRWIRDATRVQKHEGSI